VETERLLDGLNQAQRDAVVSDASPLCLLAGAGSGKTRVLTRRIAWRIHQGTAIGPRVLALTFTRKAAGELRTRLANLGVRDQVAAGTFHSVALAQLRRRWADRAEMVPTLLDRKVGLLASLAPGSRRADLSGLAGEIEWAKARMVRPEGYVAAASGAGRRPPLEISDMGRLYQRYEEDKRRRGLVDFDDLLADCARALEDDPAFAASQRWRFRHLFVDEFQDVNPAQFRLLKGWLGDRLDLCVVGDPNQAIYSWNGADPSLLGGLADRFPTAEIQRLDDNYRSSPQVLAVAEAVLVQGAQPGSGPVWPAGRLRPNRPDGRVPTITAAATDVAEARTIARGLRLAHRPGVAWAHLAVLTRTNAQLVLLEEALRAAEIPYRVRDGAFLDRPEIQDALADLSHGQPPLSLAAALADWEETARTAAAQPDNRGAGGNGAGDIGAGDIGAGDIGAGDIGAGDNGAVERRLHLEALARLAREYSALDARPSAEGFLAWLDATVGREHAGQRDAVELTTFHRAKGLEWPVVFVAGLEQGLVPIGHAVTASAEAEERRLLYVAVTRAQNELHCSWAQRRTFGSRTLRRQPSPYLEAVDAACQALNGSGFLGVDPANRVQPPGVRAVINQAKAALDGGQTEVIGRHPRRPAAILPGGPAVSPARTTPGGPAAAPADPVAEVVLSALRTWRAAAARASGVPAYVIFHDSTLAALAAARPTSSEALLALPGLGPVKVARYGHTLLDLLGGCRATA